MEFSWTTFLLEIINFLVLVWILKRFLYKPVLNVIARRRAGIEERLAEARHLNDEANALKVEYESRLEAWDKERRQARSALAQELDQERARQVQALRDTLREEREKAEVAESRRHTEAMRDIEYLAMQQAAEFATRLLRESSGPDLEAKLLDKLLADMSSLSSEQIASLRTQWGEPPESIVIASAYALAENQRRTVEQSLAKLIGHSVPARYVQDSELIAGLRITIGAWVLHANVQDELKGFTEFTHAAR